MVLEKAMLSREPQVSVEIVPHPPNSEFTSPQFCKSVDTMMPPPKAFFLCTCWLWVSIHTTSSSSAMLWMREVGRVEEQEGQGDTSASRSEGVTRGQVGQAWDRSSRKAPMPPEVATNFTRRVWLEG